MPGDPAASSVAAWRRVWPWLLVLSGVAYAIRAGLFAASSVRALDSQWLYAAGLAFRHGASPYDLATFERYWRSSLANAPLGCPFAYLPSILWLGGAVSLAPWSIARPIIDALN